MFLVKFIILKRYKYLNYTILNVSEPFPDKRNPRLQNLEQQIRSFCPQKGFHVSVSDSVSGLGPPEMN
jgi:hypothetical protein